jgi:hypothetical protein
MILAGSSDCRMIGSFPGKHSALQRNTNAASAMPALEDVEQTDTNRCAFLLIQINRGPLRGVTSRGPELL